MNKEEANKHFPQYKVTFEECVRGRDGGSSWADPENDIVRSGSTKYFSKKDVDSEWVLEYSHGLGDFGYAFHKAALTLEKIKMSYLPNEIAMFSYHGTMFKATYLFPDQKCICGEAIDKGYINEYEGDNTIKANYLEQILFFYEPDCIVVKGDNAYLSGNWVGNPSQLKKDHGLKPWECIFDSKEIRAFLKKEYPELKSYYTLMSSGCI